MDHRVVTVHLHSNENDLHFEKNKNKKNYKSEKKENDVDRFLYCNIFIYFQIKTSFKEEKKRVCTWVEMLHAEKSSFSPASPVGLGAATKIKSSSWQKPF